MEVLLLKCGEMVLKGLNRRRFEERLLHVLRQRLAPCGRFSVCSMQSTVTVTPLDDDFDMDRAFELSLRVFGLVSVCRAAVCEKDMDAIYRIAPDYLSELLSGVSTFKVDARRSDKRFPLTSMEIMRELGAVLLERFPHLRVDVNDPEVVVRVEIRDRHAFIHGPATPGAGGLPSGINGRAALLISGGIDSPVAAYMMARRGLCLQRALMNGKRVLGRGLARRAEGRHHGAKQKTQSIFQFHSSSHLLSFNRRSITARVSSAAPPLSMTKSHFSRSVLSSDCASIRACACCAVA